MLPVVELFDKSLWSHCVVPPSTKQQLSGSSLAAVEARRIAQLEDAKQQHEIWQLKADAAAVDFNHSACTAVDAVMRNARR